MNKNIVINYNTKRYKKDNNQDDSFDTEEELEKNIEIIDNEFSKYVYNLIKEYPLENLDKMKDVKEMISFTKDNIIKFLDFQKDYNIRIRKGIYYYRKYYKLLKKYSQKYANKVKKLKILEKKQNISKIKKLINTNSLISNIFRIVEIKKKENELYKEINDYKYSDENIQENLNINEIYENKSIEYNKKYNLLNSLFNNCVRNYGNNEKILKIFPKYLLEKYNLIYGKNEDFNNIDNYLDISLVDNDENNLDKEDEKNNNKNLYYVDSNLNDEIDYELDNSLKEFYKENRNIPVVKFKKIHDNNYKYGDIQIIIIEEGDKIKIKDDKGIFSLDNFIKLNSNK